MSEGQPPSWPPNGGTLTYRVSELEHDVRALSKKVDRLTWALVTLTLSIAGSAVIFALTVLSIKGRA
jgi:hypothetical protein